MRRSKYNPLYSRNISQEFNGIAIIVWKGSNTSSGYWVFFAGNPSKAANFQISLPFL